MDGQDGLHKIIDTTLILEKIKNTTIQISSSEVGF